MARESAVVIPGAAAEPVAASWPARFDRSAAQGMPAHITVLYPFLPSDGRRWRPRTRLPFGIASTTLR